MKVLYILHDTKMSGSAISFLNMAGGLASKGVELSVVIPDNTKKQPAFMEALGALGCTVHEAVVVNSSFEAFSPTRVRMAFRMLDRRLNIKRRKARSLEQIKEIIRSEKPDIVHTNTSVVQEGFLAARELGVPHVWHIREYQDLDFKLRTYPSKVALESMLKESVCIAISEDLLKHFGLDDSENARCIYNGIRESADAVLPKEKYFLTASQVNRAKCIEDAIRAFALFWPEHRDYSLKIAGAGSEVYVARLRRLAHSLGCPAVEFLGFRRDVPGLMGRAKALIVPSSYEGFGRMTAEAAFSGCAVIGRNTGGTKEILGITGGWCFDDVPQLAAQMETLASMDQEAYDTAVERAQAAAVASFTVSANVEAVYSLYLSLLGKNL